MSESTLNISPLRNSVMIKQMHVGGTNAHRQEIFDFDCEKHCAVLKPVGSDGGWTSQDNVLMGKLFLTFCHRMMLKK